MTVTQLNYYSNTDQSIEDLQNTTDGVFIGHHQVSLTNYDNTSLPAIAVGSIVENNGSLFKFTSETAISGSPSDGSVYIMLVPSGDPALGTATVTPTFTNTSPTWSDTKQGWYGTGGSANYRYLEFVIYKSSTSYSPKNIFETRNKHAKFKTNIQAYSTNSQLIATNTPTLVDFDDKSYDYNSDFSTLSNRFTSSKNCLYFVSASITFSSADNSGPITLYIYKGGSSIQLSTLTPGTSDIICELPISSIVYLASGEYLELFVDSVVDSAYQVTKAAWSILEI